MKEIIEKKHSFSTSFCNMGRYSWKTGKDRKGKKLNPVLFYLFFRRCLFAVFPELPAVPHDFFKRV